MSTRYTISDADAVALFDGGDLTVAATPVAGNYIIEVGDNIWDETFRSRIHIAIGHLLDSLREAQWPVGPLAVSFASIAALETPKGQVVTGNGANAPAITEDGIRIAYQLPITGAGPTSGGTGLGGMGGSGSSVNKLSNITRKMRQVIRESLATIAVIPP